MGREGLKKRKEDCLGRGHPESRGRREEGGGWEAARIQGFQAQAELWFREKRHSRVWSWPPELDPQGR